VSLIFEGCQAQTQDCFKLKIPKHLNENTPRKNLIVLRIHTQDIKVFKLPSVKNQGNSLL